MEPSAGDLSVRLKQRAVIEFLTAENVNPTNIHRRLQAVYGQETVDRTTVNRWALKFRESETGRAQISDQPRSGRPVTATDEAHQLQVHNLIQSNRRIKQREIANQIGISQDRVCVIINLLGYRKLSARWVPRNLTEAQKAQRVTCCQQLLQRFHEEGDEFLLKIVTGDESWVHHYDPEEKSQSKEYRHSSSPPPRKFKVGPSAGKILLTVFWDGTQVLLTDFLEKGTTINSPRYIETLRKLRRRVCRVRGSTDRILLQHDNATPHTSHATREALTKLKFETLPHPPYSPDLAPCDFYLFPNLKRYLKGNKFSSDDEVREAVQAWLRSKNSEYFADGMRKLVHRWECCIALAGDYVEKQ